MSIIIIYFVFIHCMCHLIMQQFIKAPEKGLGVWLSLCTMYVYYLLACYFERPYRKQQSIGYVYSIFNVKALSAHSNDLALYWISCTLVLLCIITWSLLSIVDIDPGSIDTRLDDFDAAMYTSMQHLNCPHPQSICRTTLVRKPFRSKYCSHIGCVVAKMDHYCIWLNTTIGAKNHRVFFYFVFYHAVGASVATALITR